MVFRLFESEVRSLTQQALGKLGYAVERLKLEEPPSLEFGDLSVAFFDMARKMGVNPSDLAEEVALAVSPLEKRFTERVSPVGGYLNFFANTEELAFEAIAQALSGRIGRVDLGEGMKVSIEHTSVNPNKALHIGHIRNAVIGDTIVRILRFTGHDVSVLNYIDDSGLQVAELVAGLLHLGFPLEPPPGVRFDAYCGDTVYVGVSRIIKENPEKMTLVRQVLKELESPDSPTSKFALRITKRILSDQLSTASRIGVEYDCLNFESDVVKSKLWDAFFERAKAEGLISYVTEGKLKGCWVLRVVGEDKVLVRSDRTVTYLGKDVPYALWKLGVLEDPFSYELVKRYESGRELWRTTAEPGVVKLDRFHGSERTITVIDVRQSRLQEIIREVISKILGEEQRNRYVHLGYEVVSLSAETAKELGLRVEGREFLHMSGRAGLYVNAETVLDLLAERAQEESKKRNPDMNEEELRKISESIAVAALRYSLLKQDIGKMITFDLAESLRLEDDSGPYLQYTYARASRVLEKWGERPELSRELVGLLKSAEEIDLAKRISKVDQVIEATARTLNPALLAGYAKGLCLSFNTFYEKHPVIRAESAELGRARVLLVVAFRETLGLVMDLLGLPHPERI